MAHWNNYITALWLILYLPKMAYLFVREYWRKIALFLGFVGVSFLIALVLGLHTDTECKKKANGAFSAIDLTAAFATGEKRSMQVELIAIHHTAGNPNGTVNDVAKVHLGQNKWNGVGYHYFVDRSGTVYQLRPLDERVPHAYGCNDNAVAICLAGNFNDYDVPTAQWDATLQLTRWLCGKYNLTSRNVYGHGELTGYSAKNATDCCGKRFDMKKFRNAL